MSYGHGGADAACSRASAVACLVGTIAGDDTVLGIVAETIEPQETIEAIWSLVDEGLVNA